MTPKEKAEELIKKFHPFTYTAVHAHKTSGEYADAKQCALIAVDEMLQIKSITMYPVAEDNMIYGYQDYWQQVKQEIEKL